jgi:hypothetical protein
MVTEYISVSNQEIKFVAPAEVTTCASGENSFITFGGQSVDLTFNYDASVAPVIDSLSRNNASPVLKTPLTISGSNFGADLSAIRVFLKGSENKYELSVLEVSENQIQCILGGGKTGDYELMVMSSTTGCSIPNSASTFSYKIVVQSLSLSQVAIGGGVDLTITGYNFQSSFKSTNVMIGIAVNVFCPMKSLTDTEIVCTIPPMHEDYESG